MTGKKDFCADFLISQADCAFYLLKKISSICVTVSLHWYLHNDLVFVLFFWLGFRFSSMMFQDKIPRQSAKNFSFEVWTRASWMKFWTQPKKEVLGRIFFSLSILLSLEKMGKKIDKALLRLKISFFTFCGVLFLLCSPFVVIFWGIE